MEILKFDERCSECGDHSPVLIGEGSSFLCRECWKRKDRSEREPKQKD